MSHVERSCSHHSQFPTLPHRSLDALKSECVCCCPSVMVYRRGLKWQDCSLIEWGEWPQFIELCKVKEKIGISKHKFASSKLPRVAQQKVVQRHLCSAHPRVEFSRGIKPYILKIVLSLALLHWALMDFIANFKNVVKKVQKILVHNILWDSFLLDLFPS